MILVVSVDRKRAITLNSVSVLEISSPSAHDAEAIYALRAHLPDEISYNLETGTGEQMQRHFDYIIKLVDHFYSQHNTHLVIHLQEEGTENE